MGAYHTIDLELNRPFTIIKEEWDTISIDRISSACDIASRADIAAVVMEEGLANVCLLTTNMTIVRQRVEVNVPRKRKGSSHHDKAFTRFLDQTYQAVLKHVDFNVVKVLLLASPGFYKV
jgi:protein pelota